MPLHDDGSDGDDAAAALMAETMGFAGFGAQSRPSKKRRMNDAFVERPQGSAANGTPLGARRQTQTQPQSAELPLHQAAAAAAPSAAANDDEIDLDDDDDDDDDDEGGGGALAAPPAGAGLPPRPPSPTGGGDGPTSGPHSQQHQHHGRAGGGGGGGRHGGPSSSSSASGRQWWLDYYDQRFNENPWARLEKPLGLEPRGSWPPPRGHVF